MRSKAKARFEDFRVVANRKSGKRSSSAAEKALRADSETVSKKLSSLGKSREYEHVKIGGEDYVQVRDKKSKRSLSKFRVDSFSKKKPVRVLQVKLSPAGMISPKKIFGSIG